MTAYRFVCTTLSAALLLPLGCTDDAADQPAPEGFSAQLGAAGGQVQGEPGTPFEGVVVDVPAGEVPVTVTVALASDDTPLPEAARAVGSQYTVSVEPLPGEPIRLTLPVNTDTRLGYSQDFAMVKVWMRDPTGWALVEPVATAAGSVTIETQALDTVVPGIKLAQ